MPETKLLTVRDVSIVLGISEKEVMDLAESGAIPAYKVGGVYLRFKQEQVEEFRNTHQPSLEKDKGLPKYSFRDRFGDFVYFNDFYILAFFVILFMLFIIFRGF